MDAAGLKQRLSPSPRPSSSPPPCSPPPPSSNGQGPAADPPSMLCLHDVNYRVKYWPGSWWDGACFREQRVKHVLHDVTLAFPEGQLIGIIGGSGSGKTSLLDVIASRAEGEVTGAVTYRGARCSKKMMRQHVSYVIQADRLLPNLTVRETLTYTAYLKLPSSIGKRELREKVDNVINRMGLRGVADSRVGGAVMRGVSGGEKRRVTIALQLIKDPDILLLDEPTTGLDSFTSRHLVSNLQQLARQGKVVLMSLHQPRSDIAKMLHQTALMSRGHVMYFGPTSGLVPYFTPLGFPCPTYSNPLDTYIDVVGIDRRDVDREVATTTRVEQLLHVYRKSDLLATTKKTVTTQLRSRSFPAEVVGGSQSPNWFRVFFTILGRMYLNLWRDRGAFFNRTFLPCVYVTLLLIFLGRLHDNQASIQDRVGLLYNGVAVPAILGMLNNVALFPALRDHFYREGLDGLYGSQTFLLAYTAHVLPFVVVSSALFSVYLYWATGMYPEAGRFGIYTACVVVMMLSGEMMTSIAMGVFRNPQLASSTMSIFLNAANLLSTGFIKSLENLSEVLRYPSWAFVQKYVAEIAVVNEFHLLNFTCQGQRQGDPCIRDGDAFIQINYPGAVDRMSQNFQLIFVVLAGYQLLTIFMFKLSGLKVYR